MQGLDREIACKFGLEVRSMSPFKDSYLLNTNNGKKLLKKLMLSPERILFIHGAKEHLIDNGFFNVDRYIVTLEGEPYFIYDGLNYVLIDSLEGRECNFEDDGESRMAAVALARLHIASKGYKPVNIVKVQDELGSLPNCFNKRLDDIRKLKKHAKKGKSRFDHLFLEYVDYFIGIGENAVIDLENSRYQELVSEARNEGVFCHHDYTHHNIILSGGGLWVTNFEFCCFELKIYDLANLIRRKMRMCDWDVSKAGTLIDAYTSVESLSQDELAVMRTILTFPQKFWRVVNRYYNSRRSWSERSFIIKLQEVIDEIEGHKKFLEQYENCIHMKKHLQ